MAGCEDLGRPTRRGARNRARRCRCGGVRLRRRSSTGACTTRVRPRGSTWREVVVAGRSRTGRGRHRRGRRGRWRRSGRRRRDGGASRRRSGSRCRPGLPADVDRRAGRDRGCGSRCGSQRWSCCCSVSVIDDGNGWVGRGDQLAAMPWIAGVDRHEARMSEPATAKFDLREAGLARHGSTEAHSGDRAAEELGEQLRLRWR